MKLPAAVLSGELALSKNLRSAQISRFDHPTEFLSQVGRRRLTVMQAVFCNCELGVGIKHNHVGVESGSESSLAGIASRQSRRFLGQPTTDSQCHPTRF